MRRAALHIYRPRSVTAVTLGAQRAQSKSFCVRHRLRVRRGLGRFDPHQDPRAQRRCAVMTDAPSGILSGHGPDCPTRPTSKTDVGEAIAVLTQSPSVKHAPPLAPARSLSASAHAVMRPWQVGHERTSISNVLHRGRASHHPDSQPFLVDPYIQSTYFAANPNSTKRGHRESPLLSFDSQTPF